MRQRIIDAARSLINAAGFDATRRQISANWEELASEDGRELLRYQLTRHEPGAREYRVIRARLDIIELCIQDGLEVVFADYREASESILRMLNADDWDQVCGIVGAERHRLLAPVADVAFADLVMQPASSDDESHVLGGWNLVEQCRELGVEAALQQARDPQRGYVLSVDAAKALVTATTLEDMQRAALAHQDLAPLAQRRLWQAEGNEQMQRWGGSEAYLAERDRLTGPGCEAKRIALCRATLASIDRQTLPLAWTPIALDLAAELRADAAHANAPDQRELISLYSQALAVIGPDDDPDQWGRTQHHLGISYVKDASGDPSANLEAAIKAFEAALTTRRPKVESLEWVQSAVNLAEALRRRTRGDPAVDLERAMGLLEEAIAVAEEHRYADLAANARVVMGAVLLARVGGRREDNLDHAERELQLAVDSHVDPEIRARAAANLGAVAYERARADFRNYQTHWNRQRVISARQLFSFRQPARHSARKSKWAWEPRSATGQMAKWRPLQFTRRF
jgi:hypothetical protein